MRRTLVFGVALALVLAASAYAAAPVKNGLYIGKLTGRGLEKRVELHVAKSGKTATAGLYCSNTLYARLPTFPIANGAFNAVKKTGSVVVFRLKGHFATADSVKVGLILRAACDGLGGSFTLALSSAG